MMTRRGYWPVMFLAFVSGMAGGIVAERFFSGEVVWAQHRQKVVNSEEFLLVDKSGKTRGGLGLGADGSVGLILSGKDGSKTLYISPDEPQVLRMTDNTGKILWALP